MFFGRNDAKAETPVLRQPHVKSWFTGKDPDAGRNWGQEEKGTTEDEMAGWYHQLEGCEFEWTPGVGDGQGGLACCGSWGCKELDTTEQLNWTDWTEFAQYSQRPSFRARMLHKLKQNWRGCPGSYGYCAGRPRIQTQGSGTQAECFLLSALQSEPCIAPGIILMANYLYLYFLLWNLTLLLFSYIFETALLR